MTFLTWQNYLCIFAFGKDAKSLGRASLPKHGFSLLGNLDSLKLSQSHPIIWAYKSELKVKA